MECGGSQCCKRAGWVKRAGRNEPKNGEPVGGGGGGNNAVRRCLVVVVRPGGSVRTTSGRGNGVGSVVSEERCVGWW